MKKRLWLYGILIGFINALFGAGGGMIAVPILKKSGLEQKKAQATTICIILPLTLITSAIYLIKGYVSFSDAVPFIIPGFVGAVIGSTVFKKLSNNFLSKIFALFMIWAGIRLILK
ncbi:MAG: sulfite exporter TauE/SafE family protein [Acutalibacteraceae bacterium]